MLVPAPDFKKEISERSVNFRARRRHFLRETSNANSDPSAANSLISHKISSFHFRFLPHPFTSCPARFGAPPSGRDAQHAARFYRCIAIEIELNRK